MNSATKILLLLLPLLIFSSCSTTQTGAVSQEPGKYIQDMNCTYQGVVVNMTLEMNCGYLIRAQDGRLFKVVNWDEVKWDPFNLDRVAFEYDYTRGGHGSPCPHADAVVRLTCLEIR